MNEMVMLFTIERICNCDMIPKHVTCSLKRPYRSPGALCINHTQINHARFSLSASIHFQLCQQRWILGEVNENEPPRIRFF